VPGGVSQGLQGRGEASAANAAVISHLEVDAPNASIIEQCVLWVFIALINAGLYGGIGASVVKLARFIFRQETKSV
jgi:hypothetical protein